MVIRLDMNENFAWSYHQQEQRALPCRVAWGRGMVIPSLREIHAHVARCISASSSQKIQQKNEPTVVRPKRSAGRGRARIMKDFENASRSSSVSDRSVSKSTSVAAVGNDLGTSDITSISSNTTDLPKPGGLSTDIPNYPETQKSDLLIGAAGSMEGSKLSFTDTQNLDCESYKHIYKRNMFATTSNLFNTGFKGFQEKKKSGGKLKVNDASEFPELGSKSPQKSSKESSPPAAWGNNPNPPKSSGPGSKEIKFVKLKKGMRYTNDEINKKQSADKPELEDKLKPTSWASAVKGSEPFTVKIENLPFEIDKDKIESALVSFMEVCGTIVDVRLKDGQNVRYGLVKFDNQESCDLAVSCLHDQQLFPEQELPLNVYRPDQLQ